MPGGISSSMASVGWAGNAHNAPSDVSQTSIQCLTHGYARQVECWPGSTIRGVQQQKDYNSPPLFGQF
eukprot:868889-Amphidinium_carterae.5